MDVLSLEKLGDGVDRIIAQTNHHTEKGLGALGQNSEARFLARGRLSRGVCRWKGSELSGHVHAEPEGPPAWGAIMRLPASTRS